jgi:hypothetical protein
MAGLEPGPFVPQADAMTTAPHRRAREMLKKFSLVQQRAFNN